VTDRDLLRAAPRYGRCMDEARKVIERLERIDRLRSAGGSRAVLLAEVRALLDEGEAWIAAEPGGTQRASDALEACRRRLGPGPGVVGAPV
jgi:hypothetical protein